MSRAEPSGISLTSADAAIVKGMLARGDRQHDIAAWFGVNAGRIADIATQKTFTEVTPASTDKLPPPGPYLAGREAQNALSSLEKVAEDINAALALVRDNKNAEAAIYALEEVGKTISGVLNSISERVKAQY